MAKAKKTYHLGDAMKAAADAMRRFKHAYIEAGRPEKWGNRGS